MITIWKKLDEFNWELVEEMADSSGLTDRLIELRADQNEYRAENREGSASTILEV